jgi:hypothetical protein
MKKNILLFLLSLSFGFVSCSKDDGGSTPPPVACTAANDFSFAANATKFSVTLYTDCQTVSNGQEFSLKLVLYNVSDVFGSATEILLPTDKVEVVSAAAGSAFQPSTDVLTLGGPVSGTNIYAYGVTYKAGSTSRTNGSGVVVKLRLRAIATGTAAITINPARLELKRSDGTPITNFGSILVENASITIQ